MHIVARHPAGRFILGLWSCLLAGAAWAQADYSKPYVFSTLAGVASIGSADGTAGTARFYGPAGVVVDVSGNVFVTDMGNHTIRKITSTGTVTTLAGSPGVQGGADGTGSAARFSYPEGLAIDGSGNLYVADSGNHTIRKITPGGVVTTLAGQAGSPGSADGNGSSARFNQPSAVGVDGVGTVFVADTKNHTIRKIVSSGLVTTLAGVAGMAGDADGIGGAARFESPDVMAVDPLGNIYTNGRGPQIDPRNWQGWIRQITPAGEVTKVGSYLYTFPLWTEIHGLAFSATGSLYRTEGDGVSRVTTLGGPPGQVLGGEPVYLLQYQYQDGPADIAKFRRPAGLGVDADDNIFVADGNNVIRRYQPSVNGLRPITGEVTTLAGLALPVANGQNDGSGPTVRFVGPTKMMVAPTGDLYLVDGGVVLATGLVAPSVVRKVTRDGVVTTTAQARGFVTDTATDANGNSYTVDASGAAVRKTNPQGVVTILAGNPGASGYADGTGGAARFDTITALTADGAGNVFVTEYNNQTVRMITPAGVVSTIGGLVDSPGSSDGTGAAARFYYPQGIAVDANGLLYVSSSTTVRVGRRALLPVVSTQPQSQTMMAGASVVFSVTATGLPDPSYQWLSNGSVISGATGSTLTFSASAQNAGSYAVVVANAAGSVTSNAAVLTVLSAAPANPPASSAGGGGAPSLWFMLALGALAALRRAGRK